MILDLNTTLVVFALSQENKAGVPHAQRLLLYTGVGKVNAAMKLARKLTEERGRVRQVLNLGSAGSGKHPKLSLLNPVRFFQKDMGATNFGCEPYQTPFEKPVFLTGNPIEGYPPADLYTADKLETTPDKNIDLVDMEGFALAKTCHFFDIPFYCLKYVSDGADEHTTRDWPRTLNQGSDLLSEAVSSIFQS